MTTKKQAQKQDKQLIFLRHLVKILGMILVVGFIFVFSVVITRVISPSKHSSQTSHLGKCRTFPDDLVLSISGDIISVQREENMLTLAIRDKDGQKVLMIDSCTGKILQTVRLRP